MADRVTTGILGTVFMHYLLQEKGKFCRAGYVEKLVRITWAAVKAISYIAIGVTAIAFAARGVYIILQRRGRLVLEIRLSPL